MLKAFFAVFLFILITGCESTNSVSNQFVVLGTPSIIGDINDSAAWYSDMNNSVLEMRVSIPVPNEYQCAPFDDHTAPLRPCTLEDINGDIDANDDYEPVLHVNLQMDDFTSSDDVMNASFKQKGKSTRETTQKSYRIKLDSKTLLYNKERTFQLGKHPYDASRVRNKLFFDLFIDIPNFTSLKTHFVNLKIDGEDYGLFTHVEKAGREFLINRGWNEDDNLYKAQEFSFTMSDALRLDAEGKPVDPDAFDAVIEIERGKNHTKLINMINAVNAAQTDAEFEAVFNRYFNRKNYITWFAINIVTSNKDTITQNFFLLNPLYSDTFYFLPWDYDGAGNPGSEYTKIELGVGNWWEVPLHKKFLQIKKNRDDLDAMVRLLREQYITPEIMQKKLDGYKPVVESFITRAPDSRLDYDTWKKEYDSLIPQIDENIADYESQKGHPMPFWQGATYENGILTLSWDESVDFEGDEIVYDIFVAKDVKDLNDSTKAIVFEQGLSTDGDKLQLLWGNVSYTKNVHLDSNTTYYMQVISKEKLNPEHYQIAFDRDVEVDGVYYYGVFAFNID